MSANFYKLRVLEIREEIGGQAKSVMFEVPAQLEGTFSWRPGKHLNLRFHLDGAEARRSYTISSSPFIGEPMRITVKRVKGGLVSNYINDHIEAGDEIEVMPPCGSFFLDPGQDERRTHYFFGAGSGITPLFSMIASVLHAEPHSVARLLYGNRNDKTILFQATLAELQEAFPNRFTVCHVLSAPSMMSWFTPWRIGKIDQEAIGAFIQENPPYAQDAQYYICGPGNMNQDLKRILNCHFDVPPNRIHMESFGGVQDVDDSIMGMEAALGITLSDKTHSVPVQANQTLLDAARQSGLTPPFSCQSGICGACKAQLASGSVHMRSRPALEDSEVEAGTILTCQAVATSEFLEINYDE